MSRNRTNLIIAIVPAAFAVLVLLVFVTRMMRREDVHEIERFADGWEIAVAGEDYGTLSLDEIPSRLGRTLLRGETIRLERVLPAEVPESPTLGLLVNYFAVEVFVDDAPVGRCAMDRFEAGDYVGGNRYYVNLPDDIGGKRLTLVYHASENRLSPVLFAVQYGAFHELEHIMMQHYGYALHIGLFMCLFGSFFLLFSLLFSVLLPEIKGQRLSSLLSVIFGVWILTHYRVLAFFTEGRYTMTAEYLCFYVSLPLLYFLVNNIHETGKAYRVMHILTVLFTAVSFFLHFTGILYMHRLRYVYYVLCTSFLVMLLKMDITDYREKKRSTVDLMQMASPTLFCVMIFIAMLINLPSGENIEEQSVSIVILTTGPLLFAMARFLIYSWMMTEMAAQRVEFASLRELAYVDILTGVGNRALMSRRYEELDASQGDYCLVSLDLNSLKYVNDTFGHPEGDRMIKDFATMLKEALPQGADVMRIGGDEFLIISETMDEHAMRGMLTALERRFSSLDRVNSKIPHSFAYGYAYRHEFPGADAHRVYLQADARMYARKAAGK